jgi:hypothetical protein
MQKIFILFFILLNCICYSQKIEQKNFCKSNNEASFFPLDNNTKKVTWHDTFYIEKRKQIKNIKGKYYVEFEQETENDGTTLRYFREENGTIYEYRLIDEKETIRFDVRFEEGHCWKAANEKDEYKIISYDGELETPFCKYQNLLVIDAKWSFGHFTFYYAKGLGYVGATQDEKLISYVTSLQ